METGGALDIGDHDKSYWYCLDYQCDRQGRWSYKDMSRKATLTMADDIGGRLEIPLCPENEACHTLGVHLTPDGNFIVQASHMRAQVILFANKIRLSTLQVSDIKLSVVTRLTPTLLYPLPATTLTKQQYTHIMAPMRTTILPKMGVVCTIRNTVLCGPLQYQGLGFTHLDTIQCTMHVS